MINLPHPVPKQYLKGGALVGTISAMMVLGILGASVARLTSTSQSSHLSANATSRAYYLAESGLSYAQNTINTDGWLHGRERTLNFLGGGDVSVVRKANYFWATSVVDAGTATEARASVPMLIKIDGDDPEDPRYLAPEDFAIFGDAGTTLGQRILVDGDVALITGDIEIRGDVKGSIYARDVFANGQGAVVVEIEGGIYSSGTVSIGSATVLGDINAETGISINSSQAKVEGWIFSNGPIDIGSGAVVLGHIHATGANITIGGSSTIGTPDNPVEIRTSGDVYLSGSATVYGTIYAGGDIVFSSSATVYGNAYAGGSISNTKVSGDSLPNSPTYLEDPIRPDLTSLEGLELPPPTDFSAGNGVVTLPRILPGAPLTYPLPEGIYGSLQAPNNSADKNASLLLSAGLLDHANYYFDSINVGANNKIYLNLAGTNDIRVFVEGDVNLDKSDVFISTDGVTYLPMSDVDPSAAARVYWEAHGNFQLASDGLFFGSVYTPYGSLGAANTSLLYGSYYSGNGHNLVGSTMIHVPPNYYAERRAEEDAGD